uniref:Reverse transcriptase Ty1/copia-type domain-containing protein n=1 Tax=Peronospora matthiolae TaxID=2874970 RepID=A0AAV1UBA7_9STRA
MFAPVAKFASIWIILSTAARNNLVLHRVDVKTAFPNVLLEEEISLKHLDILSHANNKNYHVSKLKRVLDGLKQSPHMWNHISEFMHKTGLKSAR